MQIASQHTALHRRCGEIIKKYHDVLNDDDRLYLQSLYSRRIVWGTEHQNKRVDKIEAALNN